MSRRTGLILGGAFLLVGVSAGTLWYRSQPKSIPSAAWQHIVPPDSGCELDVPGQPIGNNLWVSYGGREYVVSYCWIPWGHDFGHSFTYERYTTAGSTPDLFEKARADLVGELTERFEAKITSESDISLGPHTGKEFLAMARKNTLFVGRVFIVKSQPKHEIYTLITSGEGAKRNHRDIARFLDSFRIDH
jgi:hypothetical protein